MTEHLPPPFGAVIRVYLPDEKGCRIFPVSTHYAHGIIDQILGAGWKERTPEQAARELTEEAKKEMPEMLKRAKEKRKEVV